MRREILKKFQHCHRPKQWMHPLKKGLIEAEQLFKELKQWKQTREAENKELVVKTGVRTSHHLMSS